MGHHNKIHLNLDYLNFTNSLMNKKIFFELFKKKMIEIYRRKDSIRIQKIIKAIFTFVYYYNISVAFFR